MKHHVVQDASENNSLQNFMSINSMNVTVSANNKKNNFFMAKDSLKNGDFNKQNAHMKMVATNAAKAHMIKIGPVARGISIQNQNRARANANVIMPY